MNVRVMAQHAKGTIHLKQGYLSRSMQEFVSGKKLIEREFPENENLL
jgi:hypothetical protein